MSTPPLPRSPSQSMHASSNGVQQDDDDDDIRRLRQRTTEAMRSAQEKRVETEEKLAEVRTVQDHYATQFSQLQGLIKTADKRARSIRGQQHRVDTEVRGRRAGWLNDLPLGKEESTNKPH